jgi:hypothetical protein
VMEVTDQIMIRPPFLFAVTAHDFFCSQCL